MLTVVIDGNEHQTNGRIEAAIRYLVERSEQINVMQQGSVEMHFSGSAFKPSIHDVADEIQIAE